eukprot:Seg1722.4 transcript_id=Seg1722.4/GoldUCD/mRNA.D3Y31 product="Craniofacial development protein 2" protein_id=Seg1722.4/GoldUCD/D3Y31
MQLSKQFLKETYLLGGDFNGKVGTRNKNITEIKGNFGIGETNSNGEELIDFCKTNNLAITNTFFQHKKAHLVTWQAPDNPNREYTVRNQIDYILVRQNHLHLVQNSRSYPGTTTKSDHRIVIADIKGKIPHPTNKIKRNPTYDKTQIKDRKEKYQKACEQKMNAKGMQNMNQQEKWNHIVKSCHEPVEETIDKIEIKKKSQHPRILQLSKEQKKLNTQINANTTSKEKRTQLKKRRNKIMHEIRNILNEERNKKIFDDIENIEKYENQSTKMYQAVRTIKKMKPKKPLIINSKEGKTTNENKQVKIIREHFKNFFADKNYKQIEDIAPKEMKKPFTTEEITQATQKLKNNKTPGIDQLIGEQFKYSREINSTSDNSRNSKQSCRNRRISRGIKEWSSKPTTKTRKEMWTM